MDAEPMNIKLLRQIQKYILAEPRRFQMVEWILRRIKGEWYLNDRTRTFNGDEEELPRRIPPCNTASCIAGTAVLLGAPRQQTKLTGDQLRMLASKLLQLEDDMRVDYTQSPAGRLYFMRFWPGKFQTAARPGTKAFAENACKRIDHFIATEGRE